MSSKLEIKPKANMISIDELKGDEIGGGKYTKAECESLWRTCIIVGLPLIPDSQ